MFLFFSFPFSFKIGNERGPTLWHFPQTERREKTSLMEDLVYLVKTSSVFVHVCLLCVLRAGSIVMLVQENKLEIYRTYAVL